MAAVETLEIRFRADISALNAQISSIIDRLGKLGPAAQQASARMDAAARAAGSSLSGLDPLAQAAGAAFAANLAVGIASGKPSVERAARALARSASFTDPAAESAARSAGSDLAKGFAGGISSAVSGVKSSIERLASGAVNALKGLLKIASPSKLTQEMGMYFGQGFAGGIYDSIDSAKHSASMLARGAADMLPPAAAQPVCAESGGIAGTVRAAVSEALGGTNLVIPLNVDGVKLGEASIRGINRATRAAGRVLLEF